MKSDYMKFFVRLDAIRIMICKSIDLPREESIYRM